MATFLHIEKRGSNPVAVFDEFGRTFALNSENLALRIQNLQRQGIDTATEAAVLVELRSREAPQPV